jgi:hypothetical protein
MNTRRSKHSRAAVQGVHPTLRASQLLGEILDQSCDCDPFRTGRPHATELALLLNIATIALSTIFAVADSTATGSSFELVNIEAIRKAYKTLKGLDSAAAVRARICSKLEMLSKEGTSRNPTRLIELTMIDAGIPVADVPREQFDDCCQRAISAQRPSHGGRGHKKADTKWEAANKLLRLVGLGRSSPDDLRKEVGEIRRKATIT